jgi:hypothetical protein
MSEFLFCSVALQTVTGIACLTEMTVLVLPMSLDHRFRLDSCDDCRVTSTYDVMVDEFIFMHREVLVV